MSIYKYIDPTTVGGKQFKLTKTQHNEIFKHTQCNWKTHFEYYQFETNIEIQRFSSIYLKLWNTVAFPVVVLFAGLSNISEILEEYKKLYFEKKYGAFVSDFAWGDSEVYTNILKCLQNK